MRSEHLEDKILIDKFELVQLKGRVQNDSMAIVGLLP